MASGSTPVKGRPYPLETDTPDVAADVHSLALSLETAPNSWQGTLAARASVSPTVGDRYVVVGDSTTANNGVEWYWTGSLWLRLVFHPPVAVATLSGAQTCAGGWTLAQLLGTNWSGFKYTLPNDGLYHIDVIVAAVVANDPQCFQVGIALNSASTPTWAGPPRNMHNAVGDTDGASYGRIISLSGGDHVEILFFNGNSYGVNGTSSVTVNYLEASIAQVA